MKQAASLSFGDEECQEQVDIRNGDSRSPRYGTIDGSNHSKPPKRSSVKIALMGHQPCHQLEVSRRSSSNSNVTTESQLNRRALFYDEMTSMIKLSIPVTITYILEMLPGIVTIILVGRAELGSDIGPEEQVASKLHIDAAALAVMFMNVVALSPGFGMLTAMDTLCSQAHGANQSSKMGTYALTGLVILSVLCIISSTILWNATFLLTKAGQPLAVAELAGLFARYLTPGIPFSFVYELIRKVSQSRNEAMPMLISSVICNIVTVSVGYYLVHCTSWGWIGAAIARSVGEVALVPTILVAMMMGYGGNESDTIEKIDSSERIHLMTGTKRSDSTASSADENDIEFLQQVMDGFVLSDAIHPAAVMEFLTLGFPGMLQLMFEWCAFEVIALLCGLLDGDEAIIGIGANAVIMNFTSMTYMLYLGASVSGNVRIGNAIGAGDLIRAESASLVTLGLGAFMSMINIAFILTFRKKLPWLITTDIDIVNEAQRLFLVAAAFQFPDAIGACVQGIFRGSGRQALAAKLNFAAYYIIGIPFGYLLAMKVFHFGVMGLWIGMTVGLCVISFFGTGLVLKSDWATIADEANARLNRSASGNALASDKF